MLYKYGKQMWDFFRYSHFYFSLVTGGPGSQCEELFIYFLTIYTNVQRNYYYITTVFGYAKRDLHLAAYGGVEFQRFDFIKVCMGEKG